MSDKELLVDWRPFNPSKNMITEGTGGEPMKVKGVLQRAEAKNQNGRVYPKDVLKEEAERYRKKRVKQRRALGELDHPDCFTDSAEILTGEGWKAFKELNGERVCTLNPDTREVEYQSPIKIVNEDYEGRMIEIDHRNLQTTVTPNHRFYLIDRYGESYYATAQELYENPENHSHSRIPKTAENGFSSDLSGPFNPFGIEDETFFKFLGIWLADGSTTTGDYKKDLIQITQVKEASSRKIRQLLDSFPNGMEWKEYNQENGDGNNKSIFRLKNKEFRDYLRNNLGEDCYSKRIPSFVKNARTDLLENLVKWFQKGDGRSVDTVVDSREYNRKEVFSTSKNLINDLQELVVKMGESGNITEHETKQDYEFADHVVKAKNKSTLYQLHRSTTKSIYTDPRHFDVSETWYDGTIHCVSVPNSTIYVRDNGKAFWSGNSEVVNLQNVSHNITSMEWNGNDLVGEVQVLSTPAGNILQDLFRNNVNVGISSRGLGSVQESADGTLIVGDDFELIAFDFVSNPSTHGAFMEPEKITEDSSPELIKEARQARKRQDVWQPVENRVSEIIQEMNCNFKGQCDINT
jgi:hypothetical protein